MLSRARNGTENGDKAAWKTRGLLPAKGTRSGLGFLGFGGLARFSRSRGCRGILHPFFQGAISFAQPFAQLRQFLGAENQQGNGKNDDQVPRLEQTFHGEPPEKTLPKPLPLYGTGGVGGSQTMPLAPLPITSVTLPSVLPGSSSGICGSGQKPCPAPQSAPPASHT